MDQPQSSTHSPVQESERILELDVMWGIVVLGILLMNINCFGLALAYSDPTVAGALLSVDRGG